MSPITLSDTPLSLSLSLSRSLLSIHVPSLYFCLIFSHLISSAFFPLLLFSHLACQSVVTLLPWSLFCTGRMLCYQLWVLIPGCYLLVPCFSEPLSVHFAVLVQGGKLRTGGLAGPLFPKVQAGPLPGKRGCRLCLAMPREGSLVAKCFGVFLPISSASYQVNFYFLWSDLWTCIDLFSPSLSCVCVSFFLNRSEWLCLSLSLTISLSPTCSLSFWLNPSVSILAAQKSHRKIAVTTVAADRLATISLQKSQGFPPRRPQKIASR